MENASGLCTAETGDAGAVNGDFTTCVQGTDTAAEVPAADTRKLERSLLQVFQQEQDTYVRIDWYGNVLFPHGILQDRLLQRLVQVCHDRFLSFRITMETEAERENQH